MALSDNEALRVFGGGSGDFYQRSIEISQGSEYKCPWSLQFVFSRMVLPWRSTVLIRRLFRLERNGDCSNPNIGWCLPDRIVSHRPIHSGCHELVGRWNWYQHLVQRSLCPDEFSRHYDIQPPSVDSPLVSYWAKGQPGSFKIDASYAASVTTGALPQGLEFNATLCLSLVPLRFQVLSGHDNRNQSFRYRSTKSSIFHL